VKKGSALRAAARGSATKFRLAFECSPLAMLVTTPDGLVLDANPAAVRLSEYALDAMRGRDAMMFYTDPEDRIRLMQSLREHGRVTAALVTFRTRTGKDIRGRVHMEPFRLGRRTVLFSTVEDLTGVNAMREQLVASEQHYRLIFEHSHDAIFLTDVAGGIVDANPSALRLFEATREHLRTTNVRELYGSPEQRERIRDELRVRGSVTDAIVDLRTATGRPFTAQLNATYLHDQHGAVVGVQGTVRDITDRLRAQAELNDTVQLLRSLIQASPFAMIGSDLERRAILWNQEAERLYGWTADEILGRDVAMLVKPEERALYLRQREATLAGAPPRQVEVTRLRKNGTTFQASLSFAAIRRADGTPRGIMVVVEDVTERKRMEARLKQSEKLEAIGRLAGGVAHDFNNILTVMMAEAFAIASSAEPGSETAVSAHEIEGAARRAASLTRQLLAFSRQQVLAPETLDLNGVVRDSERMLRRLIVEDVRIVVALAPDLWEITADPTQLHQVLLNLSINARDAMPGGGTLRISTRSLRAGEPVPTIDRALPAGDYVVLEVSDTGVGMDDATIASAFEPFFTTKDKKGTGLGLSTVHGIVKQSGGDIAVQSRVGQGTTFTVYFPRATDPG